MSVSNVAEKLFGDFVLRAQVGSLPASPDMFIEHPLDITSTGPHITWYHCRACTAFFQLSEAAINHVDLQHLSPTAESLRGKYIEVDACYDCDNCVAGFRNPRLLTIPAAS